MNEWTLKYVLTFSMDIQHYVAPSSFLQETGFAYCGSIILPLLLFINFLFLFRHILFGLWIQYDRWVITVFTVFRLLTDFVCLHTCEFWLFLCKIVRSSVILLLPLLLGLWIQYDRCLISVYVFWFCFTHRLTLRRRLPMRSSDWMLLS